MRRGAAVHARFQPYHAVLMHNCHADSLPRPLSQRVARHFSPNPSIPQETLAARNELLEKFLAMQQEGQADQDASTAAGSASFPPGPSADDAGARLLHTLFHKPAHGRTLS